MDVITKRCAPADGPVVIMYSCFDGSKEVLLGTWVHNTQGAEMGGGGVSGMASGNGFILLRLHFRGLKLNLRCCFP